MKEIGKICFILTMNDRRHYQSTYKAHFVDHSSRETHSKLQDYRRFPPQDARAFQDQDDQGHRVSISERSTSPEKKDLTKSPFRSDYKDLSGTKVMENKTTDVNRGMRHTDIRKSTNDGNTLQEKGRETHAEDDSYRSTRANKQHQPNDFRPELPRRSIQGLDEQIKATIYDDSYRSTRANKLHQPNDFRPELPRRSMEELDEQIKATIYGQCIGDAIGLLTEFMSKKDAYKYYGKYKNLEFSHKVHDRHRDRWDVGDWTDDSDHMILIMQSLTEMRGKVVPKDFAKRLYDWSKKGCKALNDTAGMGLGRTTYGILSQQTFKSNPEATSKDVWRRRGGIDAPNGGVMRTSILGIHEWWDVETVEKNAAIICRTTHYDPRCQASAVAVSVAISLMFQKQKEHFDAITGNYKVKEIIFYAYQRASRYLDQEKERKELFECMSCKDLAKLNLDDEDKMGYTFKCLGAGFWALKQNNFGSAIHELLMEGGDADTNCAVAGALLGCKLRKRDAFPRTWLSDLAHQQWLLEQIKGYLVVHSAMYSEALKHKGSRHNVGSGY